MDGGLGIRGTLLNSDMPYSLLWVGKNNYVMFNEQAQGICRKEAGCAVISEAFLDITTYEMVTGIHPLLISHKTADASSWDDFCKAW